MHNSATAPFKFYSDLLTLRGKKKQRIKSRKGSLDSPCELEFTAHRQMAGVHQYPKHFPQGLRTVVLWSHDAEILTNEERNFQRIDVINCAD